jgi:chemotaxis protein CheD
MKMSGDPGDVLITHALGSCLGIMVYDIRQHIGGLLHAMLPDSAIDGEKARNNPFMFVDAGMRAIMDAFARSGAKKQHLVIKVAGGSSAKANENEDYFQIGRRNLVMLRKFLWENGMVLAAHDTGGCDSRTVTLTIGSSDLAIKTNGLVKRI